MYRATALSLVLILLAGPSAGVLCKAWCNPAEAGATGCHYHPSPSATLTGTDDCGKVVLSSAVLAKEDVRALSSPDARHAVLVPRYQYSVSTSAAHPGDEPGCASPLAQRPLVTALRL